MTLIKLGTWQTYLANHPNEAFVNYLLKGIRLDFRIGYRYQAIQLKSSTANMLLVIQHTPVISEYMEEEVQANNIHLVKAPHHELLVKLFESNWGDV